MFASAKARAKEKGLEFDKRCPLLSLALEQSVARPKSTHVRATRSLTCIKQDTLPAELERIATGVRRRLARN